MDYMDLSGPRGRGVAVCPRVHAVHTVHVVYWAILMPSMWSTAVCPTSTFRWARRTACLSADRSLVHLCPTASWDSANVNRVAWKFSGSTPSFEEGIANVLSKHRGHREHREPACSLLGVLCVLCGLNFTDWQLTPAFLRHPPSRERACPEHRERVWEKRKTKITPHAIFVRRTNSTHL